MVMLGLRTSLTYLFETLVLRRRAVVFYVVVAALLLVGSGGILYGEAMSATHPRRARMAEEVGKALLIAGIPLPSSKGSDCLKSFRTRSRTSDGFRCLGAIFVCATVLNVIALVT